MAWDGSGNFELVEDFASDRDSGPPASLISADKMMNVLQDIAQGLEAVLNRGGQNSPSANINWGNYRITSLGNATVPGDAPNAGQIAAHGITYSGLVGGTNAAMTISNSFLSDAAVGTVIRATAIFNNAASPTLSAGGVTAPIVEKDGVAIAPKRIMAGQSFSVHYDGENWVLIESGTKAFDNTVVQLQALAGLSLGSDKLLYADSDHSLALTSLTPFIRTLLDDSDQATARATLGCFPAGTVLPFAQTTAPTGWTKSTTHNDKIPRIVSGSASSGGSTPFSTVFAARTIAQANLPNITPVFSGDAVASHQHFEFATTDDGSTGGSSNVTSTTYISRSHNDGDGSGQGGYRLGRSDHGGSDAATVGLSSAAGAHTPSGSISSINGNVSQTTMDFAVQYVDLILAQKN